MYPTSETYKEKIKEILQVWESKVEIEHKKGTLHLDDKDISLGGMSVTEKTQPGEDFTVGGTVASDLSLKILNRTGGGNLFKPNQRAIDRTNDKEVKISPTSFYITDSWGGYCERIPVGEKEKITISLWYKLRTDTPTNCTIHPIMYDNNGRVGTYAYTVKATSEWQYFEITFETYEKSLEMDLHFISREVDSRVWINGLKIESGEYATPWEDDYSDIDFTGAKIKPYVTLTNEEGTWSESVPLGIFNVDEQSRFRSTIELKAMDNMIKLDRPYSYSKLSYPATLYQIYVDVCNTCNLLPATHNFLHKDLLIQNRPEGDFSCRDILGFVAQLSGSFAKITRDGKVALKWYEPTGLELGPMNRDDFKPSDEVINITGVVFKESDEKTYLAGTDDYVIDLTENPLLQENYSKVLPAILNKIKEIKFNPYTVSKWQGNPAVEAGDMVRHIDVDGNIFDTIITGSTYRYRMKGSMEAKAKSEVNKGYKGSTSKKLANVVQKIENNRVEVEDKLTSVEQAQLNAMELLSNMLGGHLIIDEENATIYIANSPDLAKATEWWQWGIGGFAHFKNGVPDTSITADSSIVAMLVAAHIITADMVRTGLLQSEDGNTWINLDNGYFNLKNVIYDDKGFRILVGDETLEETINSINTQNPNFLLFSDEEQEDIQLVFLVSERVSPLDSMYTFSMKSKYNYDNVNIAVIIMDGDGNQYDFDTILNGNTLEFSFDGNELIKKGFKTIDSIMLLGFRYGLNSLQAKLERGVKATEWVPAWEDVENKLDELNNKVVEVKQTTEGFRISIDDYSSGKLKGTNYIFDSKNATFKGAGLKILNNYDEEVLVGDTRGNLQLQGDLTTKLNGNDAVEITGNGVRLYDWEGTERVDYVGQIYSSRRGRDPNKPAMLLSHNQGAFAGIAHFDVATGEHLTYIDFDHYNVLGSELEDCSITVHPGTLFRSAIKLKGNIEIAGNNGYFHISDEQNNKAFLIYSDGIPTPIVLCEGVYVSDELQVKGLTRIYGGLEVSGSKNSLQETENYGERLINAYETAEYYFGDIGSGKIDEGGLCYIYIDDIFQECINTETEYHVFLQQCGRGDVWIKEKHETYFIVEGTEGLEFSWELKAKRKGYEYHRLEQPDNLDLGRDDSVSFDRDFEHEDKKDKELEKIYDDKLNFDLVNLLLKEVV